MPLKTFVPSPPLSEYVHLLWDWEGYHPPHPAERILPSGTMEITINLSEQPFHIYENQQVAQTITGPMAGGARSTSFVIGTSQPMSILSAWFKPGGALPFFGIPGDHLRNKHLSLQSLWGPAADEVYDQLLAARSVSQRFQILERALLCRLFKSKPRHPALGYALNVFTAVPQTQSVREVVHDIALSPTRFIQLFRAEVGLTPKQFCRLQRFNRALRLMADQPDMQQVDVALSCGYYDQSHFINDFRTMAAITPTAYRPQSRAHNTNLPVYMMG